jgi:hypothetical protein
MVACPIIAPEARLSSRSNGLASGRDTGIEGGSIELGDDRYNGDSSVVSRIQPVSFLVNRMNETTRQAGREPIMKEVVEEVTEDVHKVLRGYLEKLRSKSSLISRFPGFELIDGLFDLLGGEVHCRGIGPLVRDALTSFIEGAITEVYSVFSPWVVLGPEAGNKCGEIWCCGGLFFPTEYFPGFGRRTLANNAINKILELLLFELFLSSCNRLFVDPLCILMLDGAISSCTDSMAELFQIIIPPWLIFSPL